MMVKFIFTQLARLLGGLVPAPIPSAAPVPAERRPLRRRP